MNSRNTQRSCHRFFSSWPSTFSCSFLANQPAVMRQKCAAVFQAVWRCWILPDWSGLGWSGISVWVPCAAAGQVCLTRSDMTSDLRWVSSAVCDRVSAEIRQLCSFLQTPLSFLIPLLLHSGGVMRSRWMCRGTAPSAGWAQPVSSLLSRTLLLVSAKSASTAV